MKFLITLTSVLSISFAAIAYDEAAMNNIIEMDNISSFRKAIESGQYHVDQNISAPAYHTGTSFLTIAARAAAIEITKYLINSGANLNSKTPVNETALMLASFFKDEDGSNTPGYKKHEVVARLLIDAGADLENDPANYTPLAYTSYAGHYRIAEYLLQAGAKVDSDSKDGKTVVNTPLMMAAMEGKEDVLILLLKHGANAHITKAGGTTALQLAKKYGHKRLIPILQCAEALKPGEQFSKKCPY